jgi:hypothetical protein
MSLVNYEIQLDVFLRQKLFISILNSSYSKNLDFFQYQCSHIMQNKKRKIVSRLCRFFSWTLIFFYTKKSSQESIKLFRGNLKKSEFTIYNLTHRITTSKLFFLTHFIFRSNNRHFK